MAPRRTARALGLLSLAASVLSLYVTPESDCAALCLGSANETISSTEASISASDIACRDAEYSSSSSGIRYRNCIDCLSKSQETDGEESDLQWMLYNMRYALNTCLFDESTAVNSPCIINYACEPLEDALRTGLSTPGEQSFDYCTADEGAFSRKWHWPHHPWRAKLRLLHGGRRRLLKEMALVLCLMSQEQWDAGLSIQLPSST
ncbi:hypothetical protein HYQ46_009074 [Verticillium longisporum]|nr:hypothetical protein HYQ46_009074 [Verticillium longisporum]